MPKAVTLEYMSDDMAERMANIVGPQSAYGLALTQAKSRREAGEDVHIFRFGNTLMVGPCPSPAQASGSRKTESDR